jgi:N-methylhydantoinase B/oxoprolinase/acetone carboxylase alpha subunit
VLEDVREGYVSPESAREMYGVAVEQSGRGFRLDQAETTRLRKEE